MIREDTESHAFRGLVSYIDTNPAGVAALIRVATFYTDGSGKYVARELPNEDIDEHQNARERALEALRRWRDELRGAAGRPGDIADKPSLDPAANIGRSEV